MTVDTRPVLISSQKLPGGRVRYTWSYAPGCRVTVTGPSGGLTPELAAEMAGRIVPLLRPKGTT